MDTQFMTLVYTGIYFVLLFIFGFITNRWNRNAADYLISNRGFSWLLQGIGLSSLIVAGTTVSVVPAIGYDMGLVGHWWTTGWIIAIFIGAFLVAPLFRKSGAYTFPEWIGARFGERTRIITSLAMGIAMIFSPLANIIGGGLILSAFTGWEPWITITLSGLVVAVYLTAGGLWSAIVTDILQWTIAMLAFVVILPWFLIKYFGGIEVLNNLPSEHFSVSTTSQLPLLGSGTMAVFSMFWLMACIYIGGPTWNRAASSRTVKETKKAWVFAALSALPIAFILPLSGMFVKASGIEVANSSAVFGLIIREMPSAIASLFIIGIFSATMSTAQLGIIGGSTILLRDVYQRLFRPNATIKQLLWPARILTFLYAIIGGVIGANFFYIVNPEYASLHGLALFSGFAAAGMPLLLASILWPKTTKEGAFAGVLVGTFYVIYSVLSGFTIHPMYTGFIISLVVLISVNYIVRFTGPWWSEKPLSLKEDHVSPSKAEKTNDISKIN